MNKAFILGRLGQDPETRSIQGGSLTNFSVATSYKFGDSNGGTREHTEWHRVVAFGKLAELCAKHLAKGSQVLVEGRIQTRNWEDKDGAKRFTTEIVASSVRFLDQRGNDNDGDGSEIPF